MDEFRKISNGLQELITEWEPRLSLLSATIISENRNSQNRTIKQIVGHMVDSATNNIHRVVHLQNQESPLIYPDYANFGNNDKWIAIQNYQQEDWRNLLKLWKYINLHYAYIIRFIAPEKFENVWISAKRENVLLKDMVVDYLRHFKLHLSEIEELMSN